MAAWIAELNLLGMLRALSRLSAVVLAFVHCLALRVACGVAAWRAVLDLLGVLRAEPLECSRLCTVWPCVSRAVWLHGARF